MGDDATLRARFDARLDAHGIVLTPVETANQLTLAKWLHDGVAGLGTAFAGLGGVGEDVLDLSLFELGTRLRDGRLTSLGLTTACLDRIARRDPEYVSFHKVLRETALAEAAQADAELAARVDRGPLHGIPIGIKDVIDVAGVATTANTPGRADAVAGIDAKVVERLRAGGAIIIGKLATYEWGTVGPDKRGLFPPARNPWSLGHITGGSSSGCAVAVAGGLLRTAIGTDTGGSLRGPAFYCGVVGLKPSFGAVPAAGVLELAPSLDHVGAISASAGEAGLTLDVLAGRDGENSAIRLLGQPIAGLRLGYARNWFARDPQLMPEVLGALDAAVSTFSKLGAIITEIELPDYPAVEVAVATILHAESFALHADGLRDRPEDYGRRAFLSLAAGVAIADTELDEARRAGRMFRGAVDAVLAGHDGIVTAGALTTALLAAPFEEEAVWTPMRTIGFNVSGHPVLALPIGLHDGLPIGMQIVGRHGDEARIVQIGDAFERATDHSLQRPPGLATGR